MGMNLNRADKLRRIAVDRYRDLSSQTVFYGFSHDEYLSRYRTIRESIAKCPAYVKSYLSGFVQCSQESWYHRELIYCHRDPASDKLYTLRGAAKMPTFCESVDPLYNVGRGSKIAIWESKHYWIAASERELTFGRAPKAY
jgi:hypothetical protein